ncbi:MAG: hypothetical protein E7491_07715 [Ruminococcaceae bacterium]|nr:hypothetical protein [Oscillospiraceae bacterium]
MQKLVAIILSILFCMTLTCCGTEDVLAGLPEIPHNGTKYYDSARVEYGDWYEGAYPRDEYPYPSYPTLETVEQAEADGAYIIARSTKEPYAKNVSALERFVKNVNNGIEDSLFVLKLTDRAGETELHITSAELFSYKDGKMYEIGPKHEKVWFEGDAKFVFTKGAQGVYLHLYSSDSGGAPFWSYDKHFFAPLEEGVNAEQLFVDVSGVYEGDAVKAPYYEQYPFEESFPSPKQVFDEGGVVIFDKEDIAKVYNTAAIESFKKNINNKVPDTLLVYTDNGKATVVMYTYTGNTLIVTEDIRGYDEAAHPCTVEYYGEPRIYVDDTEALKQTDYSASYLKEYSCWTIEVFVEIKESMEMYSSMYIRIPRISYVSQYIVPESEAKNFK